METEDCLIIAGIIIIAIVFVFVFYVFVYPMLFPPQERMPSQLDVNLETLSVKALEVVPLSITIFNDGDKANDVEVTLSSDAFGEITTDSVDVSANGEETVLVDATIRDLSNRNYPVTISYTYEGMSETPSVTTEQFYVIPNVNLVDVVYPRDPLFEKDNIEQQGNTQLSFRVKSNSESSTYYHLSACLDCLQSGQNLVITPIEIPVEDIGPQGKTENQYTFRIEGNNSPVGTYTLELVLSCDDHEATAKTRTLKVK